MLGKYSQPSLSYVPPFRLRTFGNLRRMRRYFLSGALIVPYGADTPLPLH